MGSLSSLAPISTNHSKASFQVPFDGQLDLEEHVPQPQREENKDLLIRAMHIKSWL